jgi:hypothetical protein
MDKSHDPFLFSKTHFSFIEIEGMISLKDECLSESLLIKLKRLHMKNFVAPKIHSNSR